MEGMGGMDGMQLALNFASNCGSMAVALGIYVVYKRLSACRSHMHTSWCDIESPAIREQKTMRKVEVIKRAMREFQTESIKSHGLGQSFEFAARADEHGEHKRGQAL